MDDPALLMRRVRFVAIGTTLLHAPAWAFVQGVLPFLLFKSFGIGPGLFAFFVALKPSSGLIAPLWHLAFRRDIRFIDRNLRWGCWLAAGPFLLSWCEPSALFWVSAAGLFLTLAKARQGVWAEVLRQSLDPQACLQVTSRANVLGYGLAMVLPVAMGALLDVHSAALPWIGMGIGLCLLASGFLPQLLPSAKLSTCQRVFAPLREAAQSLAVDPLFRRYQWAQMLAGAGLMILQPGIPPLLMDRFALGYADCALLFGMCRAVGYCCTNRVWQRLFPRLGLIASSAMAASVGVLFTVILQWASQPSILGLAYLVYGGMQAGSELVWSLTPVHFGRQSSALPFSSAATFLMGLRGILVPAAGAWMLAHAGLNSLLNSGLVLSALGTLGFWHLVRLERTQTGHTGDRRRFGPQDVWAQPDGGSP